jgi:site-specific recombinase XerD
MGDPSRVRVTGPLERYASGFAGELARVGYTPNSAALQLGLMAHLSRWLKANDLTPEQLSATETERLLSERRAAGYTNHTSFRGLEPLLGYLRRLGVVPLGQEPALSPSELLLERYRDHLIVERGLAASTARGYVDLVRPFVASHVGGSGEVDLAGLTPSNVLGFVLAGCQRRPRRSAKLMVTALRSLLRYLHVEELIARPARAGCAVGRVLAASGAACQGDPVFPMS